MTKILFVCHGNICRSPMAEFVFRAMVQKAGLAQACEVQSAALSAEELGNPVYPPARAMLARHGISCDRYAKQMCMRSTCLSAWSSGMWTPCGGVSAQKRRAKHAACWIIPMCRATLQTPGIPGILKRLTPR